MNDVEIIDAHARSCPATYAELLAKYSAVCKERDELKKREKHGSFTDKADLVSKTDLIAHLDECIAESDGQTPIVDSVLLAIKSAVEQMPAVDDISIKHGYWIELWFYEEDKLLGELPSDYKCSVCGGIVPRRTFQPTHYCPNCGAKMDKEDEV